MAIKTFAIGDLIDATAINTYMANGGLVYITEKSATSGTVVNVDSCFTSTYEAYTIVISDARVSSASATLINLRAANADVTGNYSWAGIYYPQGSLPTPTPVNGSTSSLNRWEIGLVASSGSGGASGCVVNIANPYLAQATTMSCLSTDPRTTGAAHARRYCGLQNSTTQADGFAVYFNGATISNVKIRVYGNRTE